MELLAIPIVGLGGLYLISRDEARKKKAKANSKSSTTEEGFSNNNTSLLPNTNLPDKNYPDGQVQNAMNDVTSGLSRVNKYTGGPAYTDKYFTPDSPYALEYNQPDTVLHGQYKSITGATVPINYFQHNNMQPYFGSKSHELGLANATESYLDSHTGQGSTHISKREQAPLFKPSGNYQFPNGFPSATDFVQSRMNTSMRHANVQPFDKVQDQPGGQDLLMARDTLYNEKTIDDLRTKNHQRTSGFLYGYEGPAKSSVTNRGIMGIQEKNRVETMFEMGSDRWMTTTGDIKAQTTRPIEVLHDVNRPDTTTSYTGVAHHGVPKEYVQGEYMAPHRQQLDAEQFGPAYAANNQSVYENDYGAKSNQLYNNNRTTSTAYGKGYFGSIGSALGSVIAPLMDSLRPSRKENIIGNLRPYQNAKSSVEGTYIYDPNDRPEVTMREIQQHSKYHWNVDGMQNGDAYLTTPHQAADTYRAHTDPLSSYVGNASGAFAKEVRPYDAEYGYESNEMRASTVEHAGRMQSGNMNLFNNHVNMRTNANNEQMLLNRRAADGMRYVEPPSADTMGQVSANEYSMLYQGQQLDRNNGEVLGQLQDNPYARNILHGI